MKDLLLQLFVYKVKIVLLKMNLTFFLSTGQDKKQTWMLDFISGRRRFDDRGAVEKLMKDASNSKSTLKHDAWLNKKFLKIEKKELWKFSVRLEHM